MHNLKYVLAVWYVAMVDLWLFCRAYHVSVFVFAAAGVLSVAVFRCVILRIVRRRARAHNEITYDYLFGDSEFLKKPPQEWQIQRIPNIEDDPELQDILRRWRKLWRWLDVGMTLVCLGVFVLLDFLPFAL